MSSHFGKIQAIIADQLGVEPNEVKWDSTFVDDLGADSLDIVELIMRFEDEFGVEIPDEVAEKIKTVGDVDNYLAQELGEDVEKRIVSDDYVRKLMKKHNRKVRRG